jgi:hypothetical protein
MRLGRADEGHSLPTFEEEHWIEVVTAYEMIWA